MPTRRAVEHEVSVYDYDEAKDFVISELKAEEMEMWEAIAAFGVGAVASAFAVGAAGGIATILTSLSSGMGFTSAVEAIKEDLYQQELMDALDKLGKDNYLYVNSTSYEVYYSGGNHVTWDVEHDIAVL